MDRAREKTTAWKRGDFHVCRRGNVKEKHRSYRNRSILIGMKTNRIEFEYGSEITGKWFCFIARRIIFLGFHGVFLKRRGKLLE